MVDTRTKRYPGTQAGRLGQPEPGVPVQLEPFLSLLESQEEAFCLVELVFEEGRAADYRYLAVNEAFERQTGLAGVAGRTLREFVPCPDESWLEMVAEVVRTGRPVRREQVSTDTGRWYDAFAFRVGGAADRQVGVSFRDTTLRRQAEAALRESEEQLRRAVEAAPYGIVLTNADGHITMANPEVERSLGYASGELQGRSVDALVPEDSRAVHDEWRRAYLEQPVPRLMGAGRDLFARAKDGSRVPMEIGLSPVTTSDGPMVLATLVDITHRVRVEAALRESEERLRLAKEAAGLGIHDFDPVTGHIRWDERACEIWGIRPDEPIDYGLFMAGIHPDDRERTQAAVERALDPAGDGEYRVEYRVTCRSDGQTRWVAVTGQTTFETGRAVRLVGTIQDITEWKQAEAGLRESEARFRGTFDNAAVGIAHVGLDGRWLRVNDTLCRITGYPREELLVHTFGDITHPEDLDADWAQARRLLAGEIDTYTMEKRYIRKDGSIVPIELTGSLVRDHGGAPDYFISVVTDVSARKRAEAEMRDAMAAKEQFLGFISHELRTPMTVISGMSRLLERRLAAGEEQEMAADIAASADELDDLIDSLLLLARLDGKRAEQEMAPVRLCRLIEEVLDRQRVRDPGRGYDFRCEMTEAPLVDGEEAWIERVVLNLVGNAAKYSPADAPIIVTLEVDAGEVLLRVLDRGDGLEADEIEQLFEPFYRGSSHHGRVPGVGLGLSVCKRIVESMGGRIWAHPRQRGGAEFGIALPSISIDTEP
jgi:PAS domain S-box-containing protein